MPIRAQVGNGEGVTKASMTPEMNNTTTKPSATDMAARPSRAMAVIRVCGPGSIQAQNMRSPTPAATNTAVSSSRPCGRIRPKNRSARS